MVLPGIDNNDSHLRKIITYRKSQKKSIIDL